MSKLSRSSFLKTAGIATGAASSAASRRRVRGDREPPELVVQPSALPREPLVAYVRDATKGEVTIVSGLNETTFKDPALVKRMTKAVQHPPTRRPQEHEERAGDLDVVPSRSTRDQQGPGRRQHRRLRVRQPGQPGHGHDHRQLHPGRGAGGRPELLRVRRRRPLRDPHRQRRRRRSRTSPTSSSSATEVANPNTFLYNTGPIGSLDRPELEPAAVLHGHAHGRAAQGQRCSATDLPCPPCNIGPRSTPNYATLANAAIQTLADRREGLRRPAQRRRSTSTSARSSTSATCGRSRTCT